MGISSLFLPRIRVEVPSALSEAALRAALRLELEAWNRRTSLTRLHLEAEAERIVVRSWWPPRPFPGGVAFVGRLEADGARVVGAVVPFPDRMAALWVAFFVIALLAPLWGKGSVAAPGSWLPGILVVAAWRGLLEWNARRWVKVMAGVVRRAAAGPAADPPR
jgi:hypothetical protein